MLTKNLINNIATATGMTRKRVEELLGQTNAVVRESLMVGKSVTLQGLGTLEIKERSERTITHPKTGEKTLVPSKQQLNFKPVANLKEEFNEI